jgi:amino acid adenylation domain-containing protein
MLSESEERQLLLEWNETQRDYPQGIGLHQLIEQQVERTPESIALVSGQQQLSYRELDARSNQLAHYLRSLGVTPDMPVGVLMERSVEMVVALLSILKAGGAYVPLDPQYPQERLAFMADDAKLPVLLAQRHLIDKLSAHGARVLYLDDDWSEIARQSEQPPGVPVNVDQLAYVIYTSGSTGKPKGVMVSHRGIVNRLLWMQEAYGLSVADSVLQKTPFSFDVSVWEFFWPLMTGARLVMARPGGHQDSSYLVDLIAQEQITVLHFVPPMLQIFLEESGLNRCKSVRLVVCSGEALGVELQRRFHERMDARLENLYGPTEASVDVTRWSSEASVEREVIPIGRPIANTQMYVLGRRGEVLPVGVEGELFIAGTGLARGYLNRPELTAEKFIPDPLGEQTGGRLYRTGDLARYLPDGNIEFRGRVDHQVKVRGNRIELGEIEAVLAEHEQVREAVVIVREDAADDRRLVAYLVAEEDVFKDGERLEPVELRRHLKERLPEYMIPSAFVQLAELPLTPNGKVDRRALPPPDGLGQATAAASYRPPQTEVERLLAGVWQEVLRVERVGLFDNFFDLGGHSLLLVQVQGKVREALGREVSLLELFQYPSIESLAAHLSRQQSEPLSSQKGHERGKSRKELMARRRKGMSISVSDKGENPVSTT